MRRNPKKYEVELGKNREVRHPDLFEVWKDARTGKASHGTTAVFVPMDELTQEQILELPRAAFNDAEWAALDEEDKVEILDNDVDTARKSYSDFGEDWELLTARTQRGVLSRTKVADVPEDKWENLPQDVRALIIENDEDAQKRIEELVDLFVKPYKWVQSPEDEYVRQMVGDDQLDYFIRESADHLVERALDDADQRGDAQELIDEYVANGWSVEEVSRAIDKALQDTSNYDSVVGDTDAFFYDSRTEDQISVQASEVHKALVGMSEDEIDAALEKINTETHGLYGEYPRTGLASRAKRKLTLSQLRNERYDFTANVEIEYVLGWNPAWSRVSNAIDDILDELFPDGPEGEPSAEQLEQKWAGHDARIVYKWKDGFYVLDLTPQEMIEEGAELGFCIGQRKYGYISGVEKHQAKAFSLRTPAGRPKLTIYAAYDDISRSAAAGYAVVKQIEQAKGKGNRLPGWDRDKVGEGKIKQDEVTKAFEFVAGYLKVDPMGVEDLQPAVEEVMYLAHKGDPWAKKLIKTLHELNPQTQTTITARWPAGWGKEVERNPARKNPPPLCATHGDCGGGFCSPRQLARGTR